MPHTRITLLVRGEKKTPSGFLGFPPVSSNSIGLFWLKALIFNWLFKVNTMVTSNVLPIQNGVVGVDVVDCPTVLYWHLFSCFCICICVSWQTSKTNMIKTQKGNLLGKVWKLLYAEWCGGVNLCNTLWEVSVRGVGFLLDVLFARSPCAAADDTSTDLQNCFKKFLAAGLIFINIRICQVRCYDANGQPFIVIIVQKFTRPALFYNISYIYHYWQFGVIWKGIWLLCKLLIGCKVYSAFFL